MVIIIGYRYWGVEELLTRMIFLQFSGRNIDVGKRSLVLTHRKHSKVAVLDEYGI